VKSRSPGDMRAAIFNRATVYRQKIVTVHPDGHTRCSVLFQHKRAVR
jgi:hypothetical protein